MYPVGVLFGLGFDTASEIALLVLAGSAVVGGLPFAAVLSLPVLFAAGMCLFDTLDGCFMNFAYGWAFANPVRKIFYNLTITGLSVAVAFVIGSIEILGLVGQETGLTSPFWNFMRGFNINAAGYAIVGVFVVTWAMALVYWRVARVEEKLGVVPGRAAEDAVSVSVSVSMPVSVPMPTPMPTPMPMPISEGLDGGDPDHRPVQMHTTG
jgi:high-affinity nickel-transport protein